MTSLIYDADKTRGMAEEMATFEIPRAHTKITADSVTLTNGTTAAGVVADLQTAHDGNFYHIVEAAGAPGINIIIDFVDVEFFSWLNLIALYDGSSTHALGVQLYNWGDTAWDTFDALQTGQENVTTASGYILGNHDCAIPNSSDYIGTIANDGDVRVRLYHTMTGNSSHDLYIDVVALYT